MRNDEIFCETRTGLFYQERLIRKMNTEESSYTGFEEERRIQRYEKPFKRGK